MEPQPDPLEERLEDPPYSRAYRSWLDLITARAERVRPRRVISLSEEEPAGTGRGSDAHLAS